MWEILLTRTGDPSIFGFLVDKHKIRSGIQESIDSEFHKFSGGML